MAQEPREKERERVETLVHKIIMSSIFETICPQGFPLTGKNQICCNAHLQKIPITPQSGPQVLLVARKERNLISNNLFIFLKQDFLLHRENALIYICILA